MTRTIAIFVTVAVLITAGGCFSTVYTSNPATGKTVKTVYWGREHEDRKVLYQTLLPESEFDTRYPVPKMEEPLR